MSVRIQVLIDPDEREAFRRQAARQGTSLSAWLLEAGRTRLAAEAAKGHRTPTELRNFFASLPEKDTGREPEWKEHLRTIDRSRGGNVDAL